MKITDIKWKTVATQNSLNYWKLFVEGTNSLKIQLTVVELKALCEKSYKRKMFNKN